MSWRSVFGSFERISVTCSSKPLSRMRSASSRQNTLREGNFHAVKDCMWSNTRPGHPMTILAFSSRAWSCDFFVPPMTVTHLILPSNPVKSFSKTFSVCNDSSRVGDSTMAYGHGSALRLCCCKRETIGIRKQSVLPPPVSACTLQLRPDNSAGRADD